MFLQQQFVKIHVYSKKKGKPLKQLFVCVYVCVCLCAPLGVSLWVCVCVSVCVFVCASLCGCVSLCISACFCVFLCVSLCICMSLCVSAFNLCLFKYQAFVLRILLVPVLVQRCRGRQARTLKGQCHLGKIFDMFQGAPH